MVEKPLASGGWDIHDICQNIVVFILDACGKDAVAGVTLARMWLGSK
jgi:hypothetical protein